MCFSEMLNYQRDVGPLHEAAPMEAKDKVGVESHRVPVELCVNTCIISWEK